VIVMVLDDSVASRNLRRAIVTNGETSSYVALEIPTSLPE